MATPEVDHQLGAILRAAVSHGTTGASPWPAAPVSGDVFAELMPVVVRDRLTGVIAQAIFEGAFPVSETQFQLVTDYHTAAMVHVLRLEELLLRFASACRAADIEFRVLKGLALCRLVYPNSAWRISTDIDVLVPSNDFDRAVEIATHQLNGHPVVAQLHEGFDREFGKESLLRIGRAELDIHRTFVSGPFGLTIDLDQVFADSATFDLAGESMSTLTPAHQFLHSCYNLALGDYPVRLGAMRDLFLCDAQLSVDLDDVRATAEGWKAQAVLQRAGALVLETFGDTSPPRLAALAKSQVSRRDAWMMSSYLTPARSYTRQLTSLMVIPGVRARYRFARASLFPSANYLQSRDMTTRDHLTRAIRRLRGNS